MKIEFLIKAVKEGYKVFDENRSFDANIHHANALNPHFAQAVALKTLNDQVIRGGFRLWIENRCSLSSDVVLQGLDRIGTETAEKVQGIVEASLGEYQLNKLNDQYRKLTSIFLPEVEQYFRRVCKAKCVEEGM